ncbi:MAG TPA: CrcB family protein [Acidimicrobiales bacterium]|nr:CrcB family protein [Acidimicrobiales bacterium]
MVRVLVVAFAGAFGAAARYGVQGAIGAHDFPWATLSINVAGSAALGLVLGGLGSRWSEHVGLAVAVGFLGAFTTFSTFTYEATSMMRDGRGAAALLYLGGSVVAGVVAAALGYVAGSRFQ